MRSSRVHSGRDGVRERELDARLPSGRDVGHAHHVRNRRELQRRRVSRGRVQPRLRRRRELHRGKLLLWLGAGMHGRHTLHRRRVPERLRCVRRGRDLSFRGVLLRCQSRLRARPALRGRHVRSSYVQPRMHGRRALRRGRVPLRRERPMQRRIGLHRGELRSHHVRAELPDGRDVRRGKLSMRRRRGVPNRSNLRRWQLRNSRVSSPVCERRELRRRDLPMRSRRHLPDRSDVRRGHVRTPHLQPGLRRGRDLRRR